MKTFALALDLKNAPDLIQQYENHHKKIWPEISLAIKDSGINDMKIYRIQNRLFMIIRTEDDFSFSEKRNSDNLNPKVGEWEQLMERYQQQLPGSVKGEKWQLMYQVFDLSING